MHAMSGLLHTRPAKMEFPALKPPQSGAPAWIFFFAEAQETSAKFFPNLLTHTLKLVAVRVSENTLVTGNKAKKMFYLTRNKWYQGEHLGFEFL